MENQKKIILIGFCYLFFSCTAPDNKLVKKNKKIFCSNDSTLYHHINEKYLLYEDSTKNIFLKMKNISNLKNDKKLSECQKNPYVFINVMALKNDSIAEIKDIVDYTTFRNYSKNIYIDKNKVYYFETEIATYPNFFEVNITPDDKKKLDSLKNKVP